PQPRPAPRSGDRPRPLTQAPTRGHCPIRVNPAAMSPAPTSQPHYTHIYRLAIYESRSPQVGALGIGAKTAGSAGTGEKSAGAIGADEKALGALGGWVRRREGMAAGGADAARTG